MEAQSTAPTPASNSLLVHPFVAEPGTHRLSNVPPAARRPQFAETSALILSKIKGSTASQRPTDGTQTQLNETNELASKEDGLTLLLPDQMPAVYTRDGFIYDNDDSFETANVDFAQESIPFRAPYEPINQDEEMKDAPPQLTREEAIEAQREKWLSSLPEDVRPAKPEQVGFPAGPEASESALTSYFYGKSKTDLLNILSFCDQLEPQLLVDLFVSVSKRHPELPIFDSPDWEEKVRQAEAIKAAALAAAQARARTHQRPRHGHTLLNPRMRHKRKGVRKIVKIATVSEPAGKTMVVQEEDTEEEEDIMPPTWPKAGEGLYAKLAPEIEDTLYLADEGDDEAFSHFMVDGLGNLTTIAACG